MRETVIGVLFEPEKPKKEKKKHSGKQNECLLYHQSDSCCFVRNSIARSKTI